ncbi:MerR family DNA-binding protein [Komagataeibacter saccharivorans]|nr:MerR family DNA-binding protein [Komagataeibacter saccharivorans]
MRRARKLGFPLNQMRVLLDLQHRRADPVRAFLEIHG